MNMRVLLSLLFVLCCMRLHAQHVPEISIVIPATTLDTAFRLLSEKTGWQFSYELSRVRKVRVQPRVYNRVSPDAVLTGLLAGTPFTYRRNGAVVLVFPRSVSKTISGFVTDAVSGERLPGVVLAVPAMQHGTVTNNFGYYSLSLPLDSVQLQVYFMGYSRLDTSIALSPDTRVHFALRPNSQQLQEVTVKAQTESITQSSQMSRISIPLAMVASTPRILGEKDLFKTLQLLPGVKQGTEGTSALLVRGGTPDQNLILLDGAPLYNPMHLMGVFSTFNTAALKDVTLYKGAFPARYGGRLSSVIDITTKDGNMQKMHGEGSIGLLASSLSVEGPIKKDTTSFIISARRSYTDIFATPFAKGKYGLQKLRLNFYDINAKLHHRISDKDQLYFSVYSGRDFMRVRIRDKKEKDTYTEDYQLTDARVSWGNHTATLRWSHVYNSKLFSNAMILGSRYRLRIAHETEDKYSGKHTKGKAALNSGIEDYGGKIDFDYRPKPMHTIRFGMSAMYRVFTPGAISERQHDNGNVVIDTVSANQRINGTEIDLYAEDDWEITSKLKANVGFHWSAFAVQGRFYQSLQPRLSMRYMLPGEWALKASYSRMTQYIHLLANNTMSLPTDLWVPATKKIRPQQADQLALGLSKLLADGQIELSAEGYYKSMRNVIEYKDGTGYLTSSEKDSWQESVAAGNAEAYGTEILARKTAGRLTGWLGYTLAWSYRRIADINEGRRFPYKYDRRHDLHILSVYKLTKGIELSGSWTWQSAAPFTVGVGQFEGAERPGSGSVEQLADRNNMRIVPFHRLDLGVSFIKKKKKGRTRTWNVSVLNAYNQFNPAFILEGQIDDGSDKLSFRTVNLLPMMPSISYELKW